MFCNKCFYCHIKAKAVWQKSLHQGYMTERKLLYNTFSNTDTVQTTLVNLKQSSKGHMSKTDELLKVMAPLKMLKSRRTVTKKRGNN